MKTYQKLASITAMAWALANSTLTVRAESAAIEPPAEAAAAAISPHITLCAMLGLKVGRTYEFMLTGNEEVHYWTIRSLGANGWILAKDSRYPATWVNLSQIIAVTPLPVRLTQERPKKPNRDR